MNVTTTGPAFLVIPIAAEILEDDKPPRPDLDRLSRRSLCRLLHRYRRWRDEIEAQLAGDPWPGDAEHGDELRDFVVAEITAINRELVCRVPRVPLRSIDPSGAVSLKTLIQAAGGDDL